MLNLSIRILGKSWSARLIKAVAALLITAVLTACGEAKDTETLISEAIEYQKKGNDNAAIIQLKNAAQQEPNNANVRLLLGTLYHNNKDLLSAEKELERSLKLGSNPENVLPILAQVLFELGKFQHLLDIIAEYPENNSTDVQILHGRALLAVGKNDESKALLDKILAEQPNSPKVLIGLAQHALSEKDLDKANTLAEQATAKNPQSTEAWLFKANLLRAQGKVEAALKAFQQVIKLAPDNATAYNSIATIEIGMGKFEEAKKSIAQAREIAPDSLMLSHLQALLDFTQGRHAEALTAIQDVLSVAPDHLPSVLLAGAIQHALGSLMQAEQYLEQYLKKNPGNLYARKLMLSTLLRNNKIHQATEILEPTLQAELQDPQLFALAGEIYLRAGDFAKATDFFEKANELAPNNAALHTALGMSMLASGDREHAITELELATGLDSDSPRAGILLALTHMRANEFEKALATISNLEKEDPQNPLFQNLKGVAYMGQNDFTKARESLNKALSMQPNYFPAISNLARIDLQEQKPDAAKSRFEALLKHDDKNIQAMNALANLAFSQGKTDEATKWLEFSSNKNPNALEPALQLAGHYLRIDEKEKALLLARKLFGTHPNEPRVLEALGRIQLAHNDHAAALDSFEKLAARLPESAAAQLQIANIHSIMKDYPAASSALKKALFINPDYVEAKAALARLAFLENNENEAMTIAQKIQQDHANLPVGYELEGDLLIRQQQPDAATQAFEKAYTIAQTGPLMIKLHTALNLAGNDKKAHTQITQWLSDNPNDGATRLYLANHYLTKQQYAEATKEYEAILKINPRHLISLNNLAWLYQQNKDSRAIEMAENAYQLAPESPAIQDTLGWIYIENNNIQKGLPLLQNAASQLSDNPTIQYHYAYALAETGNPAQARPILDKIISSGNDFPEMDQARSLLQQIQ